jgi:hypothetical protein
VNNDRTIGRLSKRILEEIRTILQDALAVPEAFIT